MECLISGERFQLGFSVIPFCVFAVGDILGAQTVEDAIARATPAACSSGFSLNLLTRGTPTDGVNIEV